jgi:hypothetical protein
VQAIGLTGVAQEASHTSFRCVCWCVLVRRVVCWFQGPVALQWLRGLDQLGVVESKTCLVVVFILLECPSLSRSTSSGCSHHLFIVLSDGYHVPLVVTDQGVVHFSPLNQVPSQALCGVRMEELGVGVAFSNRTLLASLLPVSATHGSPG